MVTDPKEDGQWDDGIDDGLIISLNWAVIQGLVVDGQWARPRTK